MVIWQLGCETLIQEGVKNMGYKEDLVTWAGQKYHLHLSAQKKPIQQMQIKRGEIYWAVLGKNVGSEQNERRPILVIQNDKGNRFSSTTIVAPITTSPNSGTNRAKPLPTEVIIDLVQPDTSPGAAPGATKTLITGVIRLQQLRVLSKARLEKLICNLNDSGLTTLNPNVGDIMVKVRDAAIKSLELDI
jgi:mRNA interferase MazF